MRWACSRRSRRTTHRASSYLTDVVALARQASLTTAVVLADEREVMGVNDRVQLAAAERPCRHGCVAKPCSRRDADRPGLDLLSHDTQIGRDVVIEPHVVFGPGVTIADRRRHPCPLPSRRLQRGSRARPSVPSDGSGRAPSWRRGEGRQFRGDQVGADRRGRQGQPLTYIGDASVGEKANIGAGVITAITTVSASTAPASAPTLSSARTRPWSRRSRSGRAPMSARAR